MLSLIIKKISFCIKLLILKKATINFKKTTFLKRTNYFFSLTKKKVINNISFNICNKLNLILFFNTKTQTFRYKNAYYDVNTLFITNIFFKHRGVLKFLNLLDFYFITFFESFFKSRVYFNVKKLNNFLKIVTKFRYFKKLIFKFKRYLLWIRFEFALDLVKILTISLYLKDSAFFLTWLGKNLYFMKVKPMKKALSFIRSLIRKYLKPFMKIFSIVGLYFDARGKFGLSGTAKKKHYKVIFGKTSFSDKQLRVNMAKEPIITQTGVLGCTFCIFF